MVLLASAVISKQNGKILVSRQFVEMTRSRIEGVLTAFSKLITKDKQHTFIETDTVRYVYQALMDKLYCVLITTKTSNILEDLETLRLFVRVINEYTTTNKNLSDEQAILENAFTLICAFDEIVALGYRENVNMSQVRTFIEMDSHDERVFEAVRKTQEREAKQKMREKAKELSKIQRTQQSERLRMSAIGSGGSSGGNSYSGGGVNSSNSSYDDRNKYDSSRNISNSSSIKPSSSISKPKGPSKALKLGSKNQGLFAPPQEEQQLTSELKQETKIVTANLINEPVQITIEEQLNMQISRDGAVHSSELTGVVHILILDEKFAKVKLLFDCEDQENVQIQTHPNVDKELFRQKGGLVTLRQKSFPVNSAVSILKYRRINPSGKNWPPLVLNCWPNGNNCNVELVINKPLTELSISIPCPSQPTVNECTDGDYTYKRGFLVWDISVISSNTKSATIDFDLSSSVSNDDFFPISCTFNSSQNLAGLLVEKVIDDEVDDVKWSLDSKLVVDKYQVI